MFCICGTYLHINSNIVICHRCNHENICFTGDNKECNFKIEPMVRRYSNNLKAVDLENKGAKIKYTCPECNSEEMYYKSMQLRSADEGQTIFYECDCGFRMKVNS
ncbi:DNA-directed RNA polymerase I, subunit M [Spraguea lophii 42_110]|uniref:DNA-directed RNA polymerase I subunit RPA12 n=1 Tax=Spraguea lophii (strain 42_110) TaxID=1358809 RepID=S7XU28_SPRLO|nr:DNA-directed RNA polymerase I, subunit M [Spraguea lophii 42_110]